MDIRDPLETPNNFRMTAALPHLPRCYNQLTRLLQDNAVFVFTEDNVRTGDGDELEADSLEHATNLKETGALKSCPAYDRDGSKSTTSAEGTTRYHGAATRRLTASRSTPRRRPLVGMDEFNRHTKGFVPLTLEGANRSSVTAGKHGLGKGRACDYEDRNDGSYARERQSKSDDRLGVRPKEINGDECGSYQVTNQSAVELACYSSVHENFRKRDALGERLANAFWSRRQQMTCLR